MTGGGSSLLPYPVEPLDLDDIVNTARQMFSQGATIEDVNTVRKHLEVLKGGGLAEAAMPAQVRSGSGWIRIQVVGTMEWWNVLLMSAYEVRIELIDCQEGQISFFLIFFYGCYYCSTVSFCHCL